MRNARRVVGILGALAGGALSCGGMLVGCGGDDTVSGSNDDGGDATAEGGGDAAVRLDARADVAADGAQGDARVDAGTTPDTGADTATTADARPDAGVAPDSGADARPPDATVDACTSCGMPDATVDAHPTTDAATTDAPTVLPDVGPDVAPDVGPDVAPDVAADVANEAGPDAGADGGGPADALPDIADVGPDRTEELAFPGLVATALCNQVALCCAPDGGTSHFNMSQCVTDLTGSGYQNSSYGEFAIPNGNIIYNANVAAACLTALNSIGGSCNVTATVQSQLLTDCFDALTGTLPTGSACQTSLECATGHFCAPTDGGPTGACAALRAIGQPCGDFGDNAIQHVSSEICSYRASGNTGATCVTFDDAGAPTLSSSWTCQPQYAFGETCNIDTDCIPPMICDLGSAKCVSTNRQLVDPPTACPAYTLP